MYCRRETYAQNTLFGVGTTMVNCKSKHILFILTKLVNEFKKKTF